MGRDDGDIGWGHGRKATTHSLTLYAVKLLGNDFVTLLVPQRSPLPFNKDMNSCGRDSFFERVTDRGEDAWRSPRSRSMHITERGSVRVRLCSVCMSLIYVRFA